MSVTIVPCLSPLSLAGTGKKENTIFFLYLSRTRPRDIGDSQGTVVTRAHHGGDGVFAIDGRAERSIK
jgi:hypothetical protein